MAPLPGVGMKAMSAVRAVRTLQLGCQCSGWWLLMLRHTCGGKWRVNRLNASDSVMVTWAQRQTAGGTRPQTLDAP